MSTLPLPSPVSNAGGPMPPRGPLAAGLALAGRAWRASSPLALVGLGTLALLVPFVVGVVVDPRIITGAPAWLKPAKFAVSIGIYALTLIWFLSFVQGHRRLVVAIAWGTAVGFLVEMAVIGDQAGRGTTSHFNDATPLDNTLFIAMAVAIVAISALGLATAVLLLRQRFAHRNGPRPAHVQGSVRPRGRRRGRRVRPSDRRLEHGRPSHRWPLHRGSRPRSRPR